MSAVLKSSVCKEEASTRMKARHIASSTWQTISFGKLCCSFNFVLRGRSAAETPQYLLHRFLVNWSKPWSLTLSPRMATYSAGACRPRCSIFNSKGLSTVAMIRTLGRGCLRGHPLGDRERQYGACLEFGVQPRICREARPLFGLQSAEQACSLLSVEKPRKAYFRPS